MAMESVRYPMVRNLPYVFLRVERLTKTQIVCVEVRGAADMDREVRLYRDGNIVGGGSLGRATRCTEAHIQEQEVARKRLRLSSNLRWLSEHWTTVDKEPIDMLHPLMEQVTLARARAEARMQTNEAKGAAT